MRFFSKLQIVGSLKRYKSTNITVTTLTIPIQVQKLEKEYPESLQPAPRDPTIDIVTSTTEGMVKNGVRIFRPAVSTMQSGKDKSRHWQIDFDILQHGNRWENQLVGWRGTADPVQSLCFKFPSKESAIEYAKRQGWSYTIQEPNFPKFKVKTYKENFAYNPNELRFIYTK
ncbi:hypothetical protein BB561_004763 [Smittium simulii]|uniref:NADH dehydrogenase [ubiquinone] iron-sulfur protein 4, mitochondrial n=1 Tax=Smittium simulii TaxID=133385 RepID=A0A2T9YED2_9FUNG|nr:hypothetical protein BB561_004763 [Smittium simulii]